MKKSYFKPAMQVMIVSCETGLLQASSVSGASSNVGFNEKIEGGSGTARARGFGAWDSEDDDFDEE